MAVAKVPAARGTREIEMAKLLAMKEVAEKVGYSESKVYQMIRKDQFPAGKRMPTGGVRWLDTDVDAWIMQTFDEAPEARLAPV